MLIGFRFLAGCFGVAPVTIGGGTIADLMKPEDRGAAMSIWAMGELFCRDTQMRRKVPADKLSSRPPRRPHRRTSSRRLPQRSSRLALDLLGARHRFRSHFDHGRLHDPGDLRARPAGASHEASAQRDRQHEPPIKTRAEPPTQRDFRPRNRSSDETHVPQSNMRADVSVSPSQTLLNKPRPPRRT